MNRSAKYRTQAFCSWNALIVFVAVVFGLSVFSPVALAQSGAGSIQGTVTDTSGAVIIGASIRAVNRSTEIVIGTKTNSAGFYQVPSLNAGTYDVEISAPQMETSKQTIELLVAQTAVINAVMMPGSVTQRVEVTSNVVQLADTSSGVLTYTLENARINELPLNGRNLDTLIGETSPGFEVCAVSGAATCANGETAPMSEVVADGASLANRVDGGDDSGQEQMIDPDSVQEVRVDAAGAGAQYALPTTVILNTKSGTNHLHGTFFETARNNDFGIARTRNESYQYSQPEYIRNEFGLSAGGPIVIPHVYQGKDRSFWFFSYERYSLAEVDSESDLAPTVAMRNGDFSGLTNSSNVLQELYDPNTTASNANCPEPSGDGAATASNTYCRTPFPGNASLGTSYNYINPNRESPTAAVLNAMTPLPTNSNNPLVKSNLTALDPVLAIEPQITFRLDHEFSENNRAYLRFSQNISTQTGPIEGNEAYTLPATTPGGFKIPYGASGISSAPYRLYAAALGYTHVFSPTFYSELVLSQSWSAADSLAGGNPSLDYESALGLPNDFGEKGVPYFEDVFMPMLGTQYQYTMSWTIPQLDENLTKIVGKHKLEFGFRYRFEGIGNLPGDTEDALLFDGLGTGLLNPSTYSASAAGAYGNSGQLNADEFIGAAYDYTNNLEPPYEHIHDMEIDGYIQDNWRVRNKLTLNLGLRYEAHPATWEGEGAMVGFDLKNDAIVTSAPTTKLIAEGLTTQAIITNDELNDVKFETPSQANLPPMLVYNYNLNFLPRVGVAWQPFGKWGTVVRGAIGRYLYPESIRESYRLLDMYNPFTATYSENYASAQYSPHANYLLLAPQNTSSSFNYTTTSPTTGGGTPVMGLNTTGIINNTTTTAIAPGLNTTSIAPDYAPSYADEANFTVEQPTKWNSIVRLSYVYTRGGNIDQDFFYNDHPSAYSWEIQQGVEPPSSSALGPTNSITGEGPYDNTSYGTSSWELEKTGWSNYNALQASFQKLYSDGSAWQFMYVWSKSMRAGGDYGGWTSGVVDNYSTYVNSYVGNYVNAGANTVTVGPADGVSSMPAPPNLPPPPPPGTPTWAYYKALNRWENYMVDTDNPPQHIQFNGIYDLPFGRGKRFLSGADKALNEVVGGWQIAGGGSVVNSTFKITSSYWGPTHPLVKYKKSAPITDCRSGTCLKSYEWFNGYIAPTAISGNTCSGGLTTVVSGLPTSWAPYASPLDTSCSAPSGGKTVVDTYYGDSDVAMSGVTGQKNGTVIAYGVVPAENFNGPTLSNSPTIDVTNPYGHTVVGGPMNWEADASLFKVFPIRESMNLRLNFDAFNVFNHQGLPTPSGTDGTVCVTAGALGCSSENAGRQLQFTARFSF
jgi:hypothetical protein